MQSVIFFFMSIWFSRCGAINLHIFDTAEINLDGLNEYNYRPKVGHIYKYMKLIVQASFENNSDIS